MVIIGLWHGFTLNFLVFGLLQALFLNITVLILAYRKRALGGPAAKSGIFHRASDRAQELLGAAMTFSLMSFSMIFVHSPTWDQATSILQQILGLASSGGLGWSDIRPEVGVPAYICIALALFVGAGYLGANWLIERVDRIAPRWLQYGVGLFLLSVLFSEGSGQFIYGQF